MADVSDEQWSEIEPLLNREVSAKGGRPRTSDRAVLNGVLWVLKNGEQWSHLPKKYGSYVTCWRRFREWESDGTWTRVWGELLSTMTRGEQVEWMLAFLDGSFVPGKKGAGGSRLG